MAKPPEPPEERFRSRLIGWSLLRLSELGKSIEFDRFDRDPQHAKVGQSLADGVALLERVIDAFFGIAKTVIDTNPRDQNTLSQINAYVTGFLRHWNPENDRPQQWEVDLHRERGNVPHRELTELERRAASNEERTAAKRQIDRWRAISRFGMLWWIERLLRGSRDEVYRSPWRTFAAYFGSVEDTAAIADAAIAEARERHRWHTWLPTPDEALQGDAFISPSVEREFVRTFVVLALRQIDPSGRPPDLGLIPNISSNPDAVEQYAREAQENEAVVPLLPEDRLNERVARLVEAVRRSRELGERAEEEQVIRSEISDEAVETLKEEARAAWRRNRLLPALLQLIGSYEVVEGEHGEEIGERLGRRTWQLKRWFVGDPAANLVDQIGREEGVTLAEGENAYFLEQAEAAPEYWRPDTEPLDRSLRKAIAAVGERGQEIVVLAPLHWRWSQVLNLDPPSRYGGAANTPGWLSSDLESRFAGLADGVPVVQLRDPALNRMLVVAVDTFARWRQWRALGEHEVQVSLTVWGEAEALAEAGAHPEWFPAEMTDEERPRALLLRVMLDIHERLDVEIVDVEAARWIALRDGEIG